MREYIEIGVSPYDEKCVCVGEEDYYERAKKECMRFIAGLEHYFGDPGCCYFKIKWNNHDFGMYADVVIYYDDNDEEQVEYAYLVEGNTPATWEELENETYFSNYVKKDPISWDPEPYNAIVRDLKKHYTEEEIVRY